MANLLGQWARENQPVYDLVQEVASDEEMLQVARPPEEEENGTTCEWLARPIVGRRRAMLPCFPLSEPNYRMPGSGSLDIHGRAPSRRSG
jgi:hypothetical protein